MARCLNKIMQLIYIKTFIVLSLTLESLYNNLLKKICMSK